MKLTWIDHENGRFTKNFRYESECRFFHEVWFARRKIYWNNFENEMQSWCINNIRHRENALFLGKLTIYLHALYFVFVSPTCTLCAQSGLSNFIYHYRLCCTEPARYYTYINLFNCNSCIRQCISSAQLCYGGNYARMLQPM